MITLLSEVHAIFFSDIPNNENTEIENLHSDAATINLANGCNFVTFLPVTVNHIV
jgi:hypothetical protein